MNKVTAEQRRLQTSSAKSAPWRTWGPYLSERQWGTVREDYSVDGNAWDYFPHEHARSRAYRWGEEGLAGISDDKQRLCFAIALWNGKDPIIKERLFGLTNSEGNHGEDVKEYYFYLDSTPTHSYMKYLYKYSQRAYPYEDLVRTNQTRSKTELEYELLDTGVFSDDRYWDVCVEYAKEGPTDILIKITAFNRGPDAATLHVLPHLWFRNTWSWEKGSFKPQLKAFMEAEGNRIVRAEHEDLGEYYFYVEGDTDILFTENETNVSRLFGQPNPSPYVKDGINDCLIKGQKKFVNPLPVGTKAAAHYPLNVKSKQSRTIKLRLTHNAPAMLSAPFGPSLMRRLTPGRRKRTNFMPPSCRAIWTRTKKRFTGKPSPGCSGANNIFITTCRSGSRNTEKIRSSRRTRRRAIWPGITWSMTM